MQGIKSMHWLALAVLKHALICHVRFSNQSLVTMLNHEQLSRLNQVLHAPERLTTTESWHRHIPFAFALLDMLKPSVYVELGTHRGDSYCAVCQAVVQQGLPTRCYAVDTWQGDEHAGSYGSDILDDLAAWHDPRYGSFSTLLRMTFDEALAHFGDGSVDLLHIDGLHTYEAVRHDFESWLPKLSERAVVLFHDTNVRHGDFGVWRYWAEVSERYPAFEFPFGFGLGVLAVGSQVPEAVRQFLEHAQASPRQVQDFFYRQGDAAELRKRSAQVIALQQRVEGVEQQLHQALTALEAQEKANHQLQLQCSGLEQTAASAVSLQQQLQASEARLHLVLGSRFWRLRNWLMHVLGQGKRVIGL